MTESEFNKIVEDYFAESHLYRVVVERYGMTTVYDEVFYIPPPRTASKPNPPDGHTVLAHLPSLTWTAGYKAASHYVYFGDNFEKVRNADTADTMGIYRGRQDLATYFPPENLEFGRTYYWRIDEIKDDGITIYKGDVWSFTATNYTIIDDFESYTDYSPNRIFETWLDGLGYDDISPYNRTGSIVGNRTNPPYTEQSITHSGNQSMPFYYDNNKVGCSCSKYSEIRMTWDQKRDLTSEGVNELSLWLKGYPSTDSSIEDSTDIHSASGSGEDVGIQTNDAEQLYVGIINSIGNLSIFKHPNPNATQFDIWTEWKIPLVTFSNQNVRLTDFSGIVIGIGNRDLPQAGGKGKLYIDDICLYEPSGINPIEIINTGFEINQTSIEELASRWFGEHWILSSEAHSGFCSIQSPVIEDRQSSAFQVILNCSPGELFEVSFAAKTSTEGGCDYLVFSINSADKLKISGEKGWSKRTFRILIEEGNKLILEWLYKKDHSISANQDTVWIDDLLIQKF
jgi:hypothetical protein